MASQTMVRARGTGRSEHLVGNRLVLAGALLSLCEFIGIIATHVHTMPTLPGASAAELASTYRGQAAATGFLVGWYALVLPGRVLLTIGVRRALLESARGSSVARGPLDWAVALTTLGVVVELTSAAVLAGAAAAAGRGDMSVVFALDRVAHYLQAAITAPSGVSLLLLAAAMWRGPFPRVLAGLGLVLGVVSTLSGALLSGPATAGLQDGLTTVNLLGFVMSLWVAILVFRRRPRRTA